MAEATATATAEEEHEERIETYREKKMKGRGKRERRGFVDWGFFDFFGLGIRNGSGSKIRDPGKMWLGQLNMWNVDG